MAFGVLSLGNVGLQQVGTSTTTLFTAPATASRSYVFTELKIANVLTSTVEYTITITDADKSSEVRNLFKSIVLPPGATDVIEDRMILAPNDILKVTCDTAAGIDVNASYAVTTE